jgi:hypothetical protein
MKIEEQNLNESESPQLNIGAVMPRFFSQINKNGTN